MPRRPSDPVSLIPQVWSTAAYERLFLRSDFPVWFRNSAIVTICVTLLRVFFVSLAGYALARLQFRGRGFVFAAVIAVMAVPSVVLLIPRFLVINQLGIYDSYAGMILPLLVDAAGVFIMKNFFESIPVSVEEQARIDGAGTFRIFWSVVLPMARPALITIIILSFQGSWNELSHFIVSTQSPELTTLTKGVASLAAGQLSQGTQYPLKLAAATHHDDPRGGDVLHLPEAHHEQRAGCGQGMSASALAEHPRQPLLNDAVVALRAPTQVWSADSGDLGSRAIHGVYHGDMRQIREVALTYGGVAPEWISVAPHTASHVVFGGILRAVDDGLPDPKVRILRARVVGDGTVRDTLTITSHVADPVSTTVRLRLVPEFAPLQEVKAGLATAREWKLSRDDATGDVRVESGDRAFIALRTRGRDLDGRPWDGARRGRSVSTRVSPSSCRTRSVCTIPRWSCAARTDQRGGRFR